MFEEMPAIAGIPKDQKRRENFFRQLMVHDERLTAKTAKVKSMRIEEQLPLDAQMRSMSIEEDPLRDILNLETPKMQDAFVRTNIEPSNHILSFLGLGP
jgi:hypothetical protein